MYGYTRSNSRAIVIHLLVFLLICPLQAFANKYDRQANEYIQQSHRVARSKAEAALSGQLLQALQTAFNQTIPEEFSENIYKSLELDSEVVDHILGDLLFLHESGNQLALQTEIPKLGKSLTQISGEFSRSLGSLKARTLDLEDMEILALSHAAQVRRGSEVFIENLDQYCQAGVAESPFNTLLPATSVLMPVYSIKIEVPIYGEGADAWADSASHSAVTVGGTEEEKAFWATLYAVNTVLATKLITGQWVLSGAFAGSAAGGGAGVGAAASASATQMMASAAVGLGITAAIAAIYVTVQFFKAQKESEKMMRAQKRAFEDRARAEDVRSYYKEYCHQTKAHLQDLTVEFDLLEANDGSANQRVHEQEFRLQKVLGEYLTALGKVKVKMHELRSQLPANPTEEEQKKVDQQFQKSEERNELLNAVNELSFDDFGQALRATMLINYRKALDVTEGWRQKSQNIVEEISFDQLEMQRRFLSDLSAYQNLREVELLMNGDWRRELNEYIEISQLNSKLDQLVIKLARRAFAANSESDIEVSVDTLFTEILDLEERSLQVQKAYASSGFIQNFVKQVGKLKTQFLTLQLGVL